MGLEQLQYRMIIVELSVGGNDDGLFNKVSIGKVRRDFMLKPVTTLDAGFGYIRLDQLAFGHDKKT